MKLQNKKTGEIGKNEGEEIEDKRFCIRSEKTGKIYVYDSLEKLNEEWKDYKEPEIIYYLSWDGVVLHSADKTGWQDAKQIGNYFETKEEAEKAVEKLKAWKRLKDKGFEFTDWNCPCRELEFVVDEEKFFKPSGKINEETRADLELLFRGQE